MGQISILVVDDEKEIADLVEIYLVSDGYKVFKANNAQEGLEILDKEEIHLVLLDIMMPGMDGLEMCRRIRETNNIPIIMLSAKSTDLDKILGLGTGADDYVVKPFSMAELSAKIMSFLRRSKGLWEKKSSIEAYDIVIYPDRLQVFAAGNEVRLAPKEYAMLKYFMEHRGMLITRDDLLVRLWGYDYEGSDRVVDNHIKKLRQALGESGKKIKTVFAKGYRMD